MSKTTIYFQSAADLISTATWIYNPDAHLPAASAYRYVRLEQVDEEHAQLLSYCSGDVWLAKKVKSQGPIGTIFLFDAQDLTSRCKETAWKRRTMAFQTTKRTKIKVESISEVIDGKTVAAGNIEVSTYAGELSDFVLPEETDWQRLTRLDDAWLYRHQATLVDFFSGMKSDKNKMAWLEFKDNALYILGTEKGSNTGRMLIRCAVDCQIEDNISFAISGLYLLKTSQIFELDQSITIELDDLDDPTKVKFGGDSGWIILPIIDNYQAGAELIQSNNLFDVSNPFNMTVHADRFYDLQLLDDGVAYQKPVKKAESSTKDIVLEEVENSLICYKNSDANKQELSTTPNWTLNCNGEWQTVALGYDDLTQALDTFSKYLTRCLREVTNETQVDYLQEEELEQLDDTIQQTKLIQLVQRTMVNVRGKTIWLVYFEHPEFNACRILARAALPAHIADGVEPG